MSEPVFVPGRPAWSAGESVEVQRLIVEHRLTGLQLRALRELADEPSMPRFISHSVARALRGRGLGDIGAKQLAKTLTRGHPQAQFKLNEKGQALALAVKIEDIDPGFVVEHVSENLTRVTITKPGRFEVTKSYQAESLGPRGIPYRD